MNGRNPNGRYLVILAIIGVLVLTCIIRLFDLQVVQGSQYRSTAEKRLVQAYPVKAPRGEILDRYGEPFVRNRMGYSIQLQKISIENDAFNDEILDLCTMVLERGGELESSFPVFYDKVGEGFAFTFTDGKDALEQVKEARENDDGETAEKILNAQQKKLEDWKEKKKLTGYSSAREIAEYYRSRYRLSGKYSDWEASVIVSARYAMEESGFGVSNPYILAKDIGEETLQIIKENSEKYPGVAIEMEPIREYAHKNCASHILGRCDKIYAEEYQELKSKGYGMNDIIGKDGLEKVLEQYLRGKDGYKSVSMAKGGGQTEILESQAVKAGNYARLTLDCQLQLAAEKALKENISAAVGRNGAGGAIAMIPSTGEVLALASYPNYDPATFVEDYDELLASKAKPLINRVLDGLYSPGSTFKPLTAIAGLETGVISPNTYIQDQGKYTYFKDYQPTCLVYSQKRETHGYIEVAEALGVSCNYFFFEVGRLCGIETLNDYARRFGLGEVTGIELGESKGLVAGPEHREKLGLDWNPGDVIQAAIGQSDNQFTPAQLASYISTVLNRGRRYRLHLVGDVVDYDTGEVVMRNNPQVLSETSIQESTYQKVKQGMRQVVTNGTAKAAFETAEYQAAGKTGTAEVPDGRDNVLFVGFAPYENPEIVVAVVIEHGATSHFAAKTARQIMDAYMELKEERNISGVL
ncbi:MAG: hypothetical protein IKW60_01405 [Clostridia bacterium]|nr:hypothetical protein [Clostridia bacterium]